LLSPYFFWPYVALPSSSLEQEGSASLNLTQTK
jgi:hypothetical protein